MTAVVSSPPVGSEPPRFPPPGLGIHLRYLDGIRGLTALYVVLYHGAMAGLQSAGWGPHSGLWLSLKRMLDASGPAAVAVFIVLSGYSLMLPTLPTGHVRLRFSRICQASGVANSPALLRRFDRHSAAHLADSALANGSACLVGPCTDTQLAWNDYRTPAAGAGCHQQMGHQHQRPDVEHLG